MGNCIYLDIGNSNTKWKFKGEYFETSSNDFYLDDLPKASKIWVSNVSSNFVINNKSNISLIKSQKNYKSLTNSYEEPNSLGSDRWLAMVASYELNPSEGFIVVDIGTAITIDFVDNSGLHLGGLIFPGLLKVRNTFNNFPVSQQKNTNELGQSTKSAWSIGTLDLVVGGINQKINALKQRAPRSNIYLTGGGISDVENFLDFSYSYHKNLVLDGLELVVNNMG